MGAVWLDKVEQWDRLADALRKAGEFGLDTETYGQPDKTSPQHRARIHCWSVGVLGGTRSPRGFRVAGGRVLPRAALEHPGLTEVLANVAIRKWAHNAPHDRHALENEGVEIRGLEDSLQWARVAIPGMRDYGLKGMEQWALGYGPRPSFMDMVSYTATVTHARRRSERGCICGASPCRARSTSNWLGPDGVWNSHTRVTWKVFSPVYRQEPRRLAVTDFVPGAVLPPLVWQGQTLNRWEQWLQYSGADAMRGMELVDWLRNQKTRELRYPWSPAH